MRKKRVYAALFVVASFILGGVCYNSLKESFCESKLEKELREQEFLLKENQEDSLNYYSQFNYNFIERFK